MASLKDRFRKAVDSATSLNPKSALVKTITEATKRDKDHNNDSNNNSNNNNNNNINSNSSASTDDLDHAKPSEVNGNIDRSKSSPAGINVPSTGLPAAAAAAASSNNSTAKSTTTPTKTDNNNINAASTTTATTTTSSNAAGKASSASKGKAVPVTTAKSKQQQKDQKEVLVMTRKGSTPAALTDRQQYHVDALKIINKMFPGSDQPPSIDQLNHALGRYTARCQKLDEQILAAVKTGSRGQFNIKHAKEAILEINGRMQTFQQKAAELDTFMEDFAKETKPLERTKVSLTKSVTALKNLRMLVQAVNQLQQLALDAEYLQAAGLLAGANAIWQTFEAHKEHPKLLTLGGALGDIQEKLKRSVYADFQNMQKVDPSRLEQGCGVIDAMGDDVRDEFLEWFCSNYLRSYPGVWQRYQRDGEQWVLGKDDMARVVNWYRELLVEKEEYIRQIFPKSWSVLRRTMDAFGLKVGKELLKLLEDGDAKGTLVRERLVDMQNVAHEFETEMSRKFNADYVGRISGILTPYTNTWTAPKVAGGGRLANQQATGNSSSNNNNNNNDVIVPVMTLSLDDLLDEDSDTDSEIESTSMTTRTKNDDNENGRDADDSDDWANQPKVYSVIPPDDDFTGIPKIDSLPLDLPKDQVEIAAFELLILSTELGTESTGFVICDETTNALDIIRTSLHVTRRMFKTIQSNLMPVPSESSFLPEAASESVLHRLEMVCYMRPRNFLTGDNLEDFATWRKRQMEFVLCCVRLGLQGHPNRRWEIKSEGRDYDTNQLLAAINTIAVEILELSASTLEIWEKHVEIPYTETLRRFADHVLPVILKHCNNYPKLLALRLYECLIMTLFDSEEQGQPINDMDSCVAVLAYVRSTLGLSSRIHALAYARCFFVQYLEYHNLNVLDALTVHIRQALVTNMAATTSAAIVMDLERTYELLVLGEIENDCRNLLSDYRSNFAFDPLIDIPPVIDLFLCTRKARLMLFPKDREKKGGVDAEWCVLEYLIEKSVQKAYLRLRESVTKGAKCPLDANQAAELTTTLPDELSLDKEQFCPAFKTHLSKPIVVVARVVALMCKEDIVPCLQQVRTMNSAVVQLWQNIVEFQDIVEGVCPGDANVAALAAEFGPLVVMWLQQQQEKFDECLERSLAFEETNCWKPITDSWKDGPSQALSGSAIDLFTMFVATVPSIFDLGVPIEPDQVRAIAESVDLIVMKYANKVVSSCGSKDALIPQTTATTTEFTEAMKQLFSKESAKRASVLMGKTGKKLFSEMKEFGAHVGSELKTLIEKEDEKEFVIPGPPIVEKITTPDVKDIIVPAALQKKDARLEKQTLDVVCVRLNNLRFADKQLKQLESEFVKRCQKMLNKFFKGQHDRIEEMQPVLEQLFVQAQMSVNQGEKLVMDYIGAKVVWFDLREPLLIQLYTPVPAAFPLVRLLEPESPLDLILINLADLLGMEFFKSVFAIIFKNIVSAMETVLFAEKNMVARVFAPDDYRIFLDDLEALKDYFIQKDDKGNVQGLPPDDVNEWTRRLTNMVNLLLKQSTLDLIKLLEDPSTIESHPHKPVTKQNITRVLMRRGDKDARKYFSKI